VNLHLHDIIGYQGIDHVVEAIVDYALADRVLRLVHMIGPGRARFLEPPTSDMADRLLIMSEIDNLDITTPPPATIYHRGESYLVRVSGAAKVSVAGTVPNRRSGTCTLWRYHAAGDQFLQIEQWPDGVRMLAGASVHKGMLEVRPATLKKSEP
jgi:hypothetical protein